MTTSDWVISALTLALVLTSVIYAAFTFFLMRSQRKVEKLASRPVIGINVIGVEGFVLSPKLAQLLMIRATLTNLSPVPALRVQATASITIEGRKEPRNVLPSAPIPFLVQDEKESIACGLLIEYLSVLEKAREAYGYEINESSEGPLAIPIWTKEAPCCRIDVRLENQAGEQGICSSSFILKAVKAGDQWGGLETESAKVEESLVCKWASSGWIPRLFKYLGNKVAALVHKLCSSAQPSQKERLPLSTQDSEENAEPDETRVK